uniref:Transmembrane protein 216 n=1 Tax=Romanomermis culicivorax TaxID=13658 RepID=A0A915ID01_ROMCU
MTSILFVFKRQTLPYPTRNLATEIFLLLCFVITEFCRNFFAKKGNLTEQLWPIVTSLILTLPCSLCSIYFLLWQTYVLKIEVIVVSLNIGLTGLETVFALVAIALFARG